MQRNSVWRREQTVGLPVLGVVAGFLWRQRAGQSGDLDPYGVVQVLLTGVDSAGNYERHAEQTGPVLLRRQEVQLRTHLKKGRLYGYSSSTGSGFDLHL